MTTATTRTHTIAKLQTFLIAYIGACGTTHGMINAAAVRFATSRSRIRHRMKFLNAHEMSKIENHEQST